MRRRRFLFAAGALLGAPLVAAQRGDRVHRIGVLGVATPEGYARQIRALRQELRDLGYVEGRNLVLEFRWAEGRYERLPGLAAELVRLQPETIVTSGPGTRFARAATSKIPIVMAAA